MIVGVGRVLSVGEDTEYAYKVKNPPLHCVLWERNVGHSVRPGFADGFLFPYQEALALAEHDGVDPEEFVAFAPDEHFDAYSYGTAEATRIKRRRLASDCWPEKRPAQDSSAARPS